MKGDPLNPNSYRGIKLLVHVFKLYEVLDGHLHVVDIDKMQYEFMPGRRTADAVCSKETSKEPKIRSCFLYLLTWKRLLLSG